ncbi:MAG: esterase [Lachnospiraceae bacterium]|nr:esterase [Lachnospiraceae bacterium]
MIVYEYGNKNSKNILIQTIGNHELNIIESEVQAINDFSVDYHLLAVKVEDWNEELSPWEADAVFGDKGFGAGASDTLAEIIGLCTDKSRDYYIGGYSLAGLFALWSAYQTDVFRGVAAVSPSIWFPRFLDYIKANTIKTGNVYLSLGDKEAKTRNQIMSKVSDRIEEAYELLRNRQVNTVLEWNKGNHFAQPEVRMAKGFAWVLK